MEVQVEQVMVPMGSTIGYGRGRPVGDATKVVVFTGDGRMMAALGQAIVSLDEPVIVDVPDFAIIAIEELPEG